MFSTFITSFNLLVVKLAMLILLSQDFFFKNGILEIGFYY